MAARASLSPFAALIAASVLASACTSAASPSPTAAEPTDAPTVEPTPSPSAGPPTVEELSHAVVQIWVDVDGDLFPFGSGTLISDAGRILTNAHVATPDDLAIDGLAVALTQDPDTAPEPTYRADVVSVDQILDLAVIQVSGTLDGDPVDEIFPFLEVGDSDAVSIGEDLLILGYPGIGGDTITFTRGQVSGFTSESVVGQRAWIKTDATIAGGNSGGLAADAAGLLIGVPTQAAVTDEVVDCRPMRDTNRDGVIDDADDCVPIGGFLNGLRPVALAAPLIAAAESGVAYEPIGGLVGEQPGSFDTTGADWDSPAVITTGVSDSDEPIDDIEWVPSGTPEVCAVWAYAGMADGMTWSAIWSVDGEVVEDYSFADETWGLGEAGTFWVCATAEAGLDDGVYDLTLTVEDEYQSGGFAFVGDELAPASVSVSNDSGVEVCYLFLAPTASSSWGSDRLGATEVFPAGSVIARELVAVSYDALGLDCDANELFDQRELEINAAGILSVGG